MQGQNVKTSYIFQALYRKANIRDLAQLLNGEVVANGSSTIPNEDVSGFQGLVWLVQKGIEEILACLLIESSVVFRTMKGKRANSPAALEEGEGQMVAAHRYLQQIF